MIIRQVLIWSFTSQILELCSKERIVNADHNRRRNFHWVKTCYDSLPVFTAVCVFLLLKLNDKKNSKYATCQIIRAIWALWKGRRKWCDAFNVSPTWWAVSTLSVYFPAGICNRVQRLSRKDGKVPYFKQCAEPW